MGGKLNHSRYIDNGAKRIGDRSYHRAKETPTARQVKFYKKLYATCKEHGIDPKTGEYTRTRMDYARAIDKLIDRLKEHGIDVSGNNKDATYVLELREDKYGQDFVNERIKITVD